MITVWSVFIIVASIDLDISFTSSSTSEMTVEKVNHNTLVRKNNVVIYNGTNSTYGIQTGIDNLKSGEHMYVYNGIYAIDRPLRLGSYTYIEGQGNNTVFDYSQLGDQRAAILDKGSHLSNLKFLGSINPLPNDFAQGIRVNDNVIIENILISHMGYGIITNNSNNVTLRNIRCEFVQSKSDWAACIHGGDGITTNLHIDKFTVLDSNRAIELDAVARNITAQNGIIERVKNFDHTGHEAFTLDVHTHIGSGQSNNITYRNIYMKDSYAPTVKEAAIMPQIRSGDYRPDLPRNILYQNITVINPNSTWQLGGIAITVKDSHIINSSKNIFGIYRNSKYIVIRNDSSNVPNNKYFLYNTEAHTGIQNVSVFQNTINDYRDKTNPAMSFNNINGLFLENNTIINAPIGVPAIDVKDISNLIACDNHITFVNGTNKIWSNPCSTGS